MSAVLNVVLPLAALASIYVFVRNWWVYKQRLWVLHKSCTDIRKRLALYESLPSYDAMMFRYFWIWSRRAFLVMAVRA